MRILATYVCTAINYIISVADDDVLLE